MTEAIARLDARTAKALRDLAKQADRLEDVITTYPPKCSRNCRAPWWAFDRSPRHTEECRAAHAAYAANTAYIEAIRMHVSTDGKDDELHDLVDFRCREATLALARKQGASNRRGS